MFAVMHGGGSTEFTRSFMNYHYSVRIIDADDIVHIDLLTSILAVCLVQLQVLLSDGYGRTLQLQHIVATFYKLFDVFCKHNFFKFQCRIKNLQIFNKLEMIAQ